jgi:hypothetical protein
MISKIINRAAYLRELASNPKSFSNCPDLHGGVPLEENEVASSSPRLSRLAIFAGQAAPQPKQSEIDSADHLFQAI